MGAMDFAHVRVSDQHSLAWTEPVSLQTALQDALRSAQECAALCLAIVPTLPQEVRGRTATVFAASCLVSERLEDDRHDSTAELALCIRIIDSNLGALDEAGPATYGLTAAARLCADRCRRALAALYLCRQEPV